MDAFLRSSDAFVWSIGGDARFRSTIVSLVVFDRAPDFEVLADRFEQLSLEVPVFRSRVVASRWPVPPRWEPDDDFDLAFHIRRVRAPRPGTLDAVLTLARIAAMADFDSARPLWDATLIEDMAGGAAALLCRLNHALTDGVGATQLGGLLFDHPEHRRGPPSREARTGETSWPPMIERVVVAPLSGAAHLMRTSLSGGRELVVDAVRHPTRTAGNTFSTMASVWRTAGPRRPGSRTLQSRCSIRDLITHQVPKEGLRRAGASAGGSLNDAFLAAVVGGLARYNVRHGRMVRRFTVIMPINRRESTDPLGGNRTMLTRFDLPANVIDPGLRIREIHTATNAQKAEKSLGYASFIAGALNIVPADYVRSQFGSVDLIASNVPGPSNPVSMAGAVARAQYAFAPTLGAAFNTTLLSYGEACALGVNVDRAAIPDAAAFRDCLIAGFDEVLALDC